MKKFIGFIIVAIVIVTGAFGIYKLTDKYDVKNLSNEVSCSISFKGLEGAETFDIDNEGKIYVGLKDSIKILDKDGREEYIIRDKKLNISDIVYNDENLYIASGEELYRLNINTKELEVLLEDIPALGDNKDTKLLIKDKNLYISIGSNTNSGIVEEKGLPYDRATASWIMTGEGYGDVKTGGFVEYGTSSQKGEKIKGFNIGNGCILTMNIDNKKVEMYAHGIRNIEGWDFDSKGQLYGIVGGMEDRGARAIKGDKDYIYKLQRNEWYGWPDYSGGDSVDSGRFSDGGKLKRLIDNPPTKVPEGPFYQYKDVSVLNGFSIDSEGKLLAKDSMLFVDNKEHKLNGLSSDGKLTPLLELNKGGKIEKIIDYDNGYYLLDSNLGVLYKIEANIDRGFFAMNPIYYIIIICVLMGIFGMVVYKILSIKKKK